MKCQRCQLDASVDFAFCPRCGNKLAAAIPAVPPAAAEADRRSATVLFADLSGFTTISEGLDPEDVRALQTDLFAALRGVVERFDAFVEKYVGDAVMAVFGAPLAHEDDPQRALHAALDMHACVAALSERWHDRLGHPLTLHIGINTGRVVAGHLGSSPDAAYAVTGDAVNTAARLQAAAQAGQTLVSRTTFELAQREFAFESGGTLALKGKAEALAVYRLLGVDDRPQALRGLAMHGLAAPLIGRDAEVGKMLAAATRVPDGRAQVISLVGQAGVGKTRLLDALLERLGSVAGFAQAPVRRVVCSPFGQRPYGVTAGLFREAYGIAPTDSLDEARRKVADVMRTIGAEDVELALVVPVIGYILGLQSLDRSHEVEPERLKRQIFMTLRTVLERRLTQGPLVLAIEDLQWGDAASIEGLHTLSDWLCERPLLVVLGGRPPFDPDGLDFGRVAHTVVRLAPLVDDAIEAQLVALFGAAATYPIERALHERIVRQAGGNPLYLEEVVRTLISDGVLTRHASGWRCVPAAGTVEVPSSIEGLLLSRVDRLPVPARRTLQSAAIVGSEFDAALLPAVDTEAGDLTMLDVLCDTEWLVPVRPAGMPGTHALPHPAPRYRFASTLAHEVVYQNLLLRRRTELHQRTGMALEGLHGTSPTRLEDLDALCHHFSLGEDRARGARYLVAAGDWARGIYANEDALRYYTRALAILRNLGAPDGHAIASIREHMGDLLGTLGRRDEAHVQFDAVLDLARAAEDPVREGRVQRKQAGLHWDAASAKPASSACAKVCGCSSAALRLWAATSMPISNWRTYSTRSGGTRFEPATTKVQMSGPGARCCRPNMRRSVGATIPSQAGRRLWPSRIHSIRSAPRSPGSGAQPKRWKGSSAVPPWRRPRGCSRPRAAATPISACCMQRSTRDAPSTHARSGSTPPSESATSPSSLASTRISRWLSARSPNAVTTRACKRRNRRSTSIDNSACSTTWPSR